MEVWTLTVSILSRLECFKMCVFRNMLKKPWTDCIRNEQILRRMGKDRELLEIIKNGQTSYLIHILSHGRYDFLELIIKEPGRRQMPWLRNIKDWTGLYFHTLVRKAQDRNEGKIFDCLLSKLGTLIFVEQLGTSLFSLDASCNSWQ